MLATSSPNSNNISYIPLHRKFKQEAPQELSFCERQEFPIKFGCMVVFSLLLILCGALLSELIQDNDKTRYN